MTSSAPANPTRKSRLDAFPVSTLYRCQGAGIQSSAILPRMSAAAADVRQRALYEFVRRLRREVPEHLLDVRLFGSQARGEATAESDIDVLVVVRPDDARVALEDRAIDVAFDVNLEYGVYISPRVLTAGILNDPVWRHTPFLRVVAQESVPL